ncbi:MAG: group III truncated hemoglobin [Chitinophagaceae bacterium]|nr:group III truncated hemoglobin [Chitinophagaceae bacterium]MCW5905152.1 group III truncated hemoglobin [Chitinophagaceae bacterium]
MKKDILNTEDIKKVVHSFYDKIKTDDILGHFFNHVSPVNWDEHVALLCSFWENVLFYTGNYEGNPLTTHRKVHTKHTTTPIHFERWHQLFDEAIDSHFEGTNAEKMKQHAKDISAIMQQKM